MKIQILVLLSGLLLGGGNCYADIGAFPGLENRIVQYYQHEQNKEWEKTYSFRTPAFRKTVPFRYYVTRMKTDAAGWQLKDFKILKVAQTANKVNVDILFVEEGPSSIFSEDATKNGKRSVDAKPIRHRITDTSVWMHIENEWYVYDAASRMYLHSNHPADAE